MTYEHQISAYAYTKTADGYGGYTESYTSLTYAPMWANIRQIRSSDQQIGLTPTEERTYEVTVPYNFNGFTWHLNYYIDSDQYGLMKVTAIDETQRKRQIVLTCVENVGPGVTS